MEIVKKTVTLFQVGDETFPTWELAFSHKCWLECLNQMTGYSRYPLEEIARHSPNAVITALQAYLEKKTNSWRPRKEDFVPLRWAPKAVIWSSRQDINYPIDFLIELQDRSKRGENISCIMLIRECFNPSPSLLDAKNWYDANKHDFNFNLESWLND